MSTKSLTSEKRTGARAAYIALGVDTHGASHVYRTADETIFVINDGTIQRRQSLDGRPANDWVRYVRQERGWAERQYATSFADALAMQGDR